MGAAERVESLMDALAAKAHEARHQRRAFTCPEHCGCDCGGTLCRHDEFDRIGGIWCAHCGEPLTPMPEEASNV